MTEFTFSWDGLQHATVPLALPVLVSAILVLLLGTYAWRRRSLPGAVPFACMMLLAFPWLLTDALEVLVDGAATKVFLFRLEAPLEIAVFSAELVFALEYGHAGRRTNRLGLALLAIPPLVALALTLTNPAHHLLWAALEVRRTVHPVRGTGVWAFVAYAGVLSALTASVFVWLFIRDPRQRRPVALCLCGIVVVRVAWVVDTTGSTTFGPLGHSTGRTALAATFAFALYAIALFRYRMLEILSVARSTILEQMRDALVVLDARGHVVDANPAAERALGLVAAEAAGRAVTDVLPPGHGIERILADGESGEHELAIGDGPRARHYAIGRTALASDRGVALGQVLVFRDVTEERRAQRLLVDHQRALAAAEERVRVGRELHDSLGQVIGFVKMQAQAARDLLDKGRIPDADRLLAQVAAVAQEAHVDVREYILGTRTGMASDVGFVGALERYIRQCTDRYGMKTELVVDPALDARRLEPTQALQLLRIIQEGLTNARKHGKAHGARVTIGEAEGCACATVEDDGVGFDPTLLSGDRDPAFGLAFMRERAESVGGSVRIDSAPGAGTRVRVSMPLQRESP